MRDRVFTLINEKIKHYKVPEAGHSASREIYNQVRQEDAYRLLNNILRECTVNGTNKQI